MGVILDRSSPLNTSGLSFFYLTYVRPILVFACTVLSSLPATLNDQLERFQWRAARLFEHRTHSVLLHRIKWPSLSSRRTLLHILLAHSLHHTKVDMHHHTFLQFTYPECNPFARSGSPEPLSYPKHVQTG